MMLLAVVATLLAHLVHVHASASILYGTQEIPISTASVNLPTVQCGATPGPLYQGLSKPFPTDNWFAGFGVGNQDAVIAGPYPYLAKSVNQGLTFGLPSNRYFDGTSIHSPFQSDWNVIATQIPNSINNHKAVAWDQLSLTAQWFSGSSTLTAYLVQGSPYMTFSYSASTPSIQSLNGQISSVNGVTISGTKSVTGTKFRVVLANNNVWIVYGLTSLTFNVTTTGLLATTTYSGVIRIARLNAAYSDTESLLDTYKSTYATGAQISFDATGLLYYSWTTVGTASNLLQLAFPHHRNALVSPSYVSHVQFLTVKGYQYGVLGNKWTFKYNLTNISWFSKNNVVPSCKPYIISNLQYDIAQLSPRVPGDFYYWGGSFARDARLAVIADQVGRQDLIPAVLYNLKQSFEFWVNGSSTDPAAYETLWGGVVSKSGATNANIDFGNGYYNDHHFHYGYHLYGAAVIAHYDSSWLTPTRLNYLKNLARDIGNPSTQDPYFPVTRHKDWFAGHSWASGIANGAGNRDEESSSEGINGYYGLYMFALAANLMNEVVFAKLLLAQEIHAVQYYWHLNSQLPALENPYPEAALQKLTTIGNVEQDQAGAWLFWGAQRSEIVAIQILPVTPILEEIINSGWAQAAYAYAAAEFTNSSNGIADDWKCIMYVLQATFDPYSAYTQSQSLAGWGSGNSNSNQIWWIATRLASETTAVCTASPYVVPYTYVVFQSKSNGKYVYADSSSNVLYASGATSAAATRFKLVAGQTAYNIQNTVTSQYVSADNAGANPLIANRASASGWESFIFKKQSSGYYTIQASANSQLVSVQASNTLIATVTTSTSPIPDSALFTLISS